ncbi:amino acid kinase family protein [Bradyrhizobium sp. USDA 4501]
MAAALKAERCEIIKEVDGICSADPRIVPDAKPLRRAARNACPGSLVRPRRSRRFF